MEQIHLYVDGGCPNNGHATSMFWSMCIEYSGCAETHKFDADPYYIDQYGATNNVAELLALGEAFEWLYYAIRGYADNGLDFMEEFEVTIHSDSQYAIGALTGNKVKANVSLVSSLMTMYDPKWKLVNEPREVMVQKLGH
jgi:ribonuclease HI